MIRSLYITYMGVTEPLLHSQALNYLRGLSQRKVSICLLSFEKNHFLFNSDINKIRSGLSESGIKWFFLIYHKHFQFLSKPYDLCRGMVYVYYLCIKRNIDIIHARGTFCALMAVLPVIFLRKRMVFDMRGLMAEEYVDGGLWKKNSIFYKIVSRMESYFIKKADELVVLNTKLRDFILSGRPINRITVIPTCVNLKEFNLARRNNLGVDEKFTMIYVGSVGTWYMLSEMLDFYRILREADKRWNFTILSQTEKKVIEQKISPEFKKHIMVESTVPSRVKDYLNGADMGIFFIKPCFSKNASCPTKFAEYLACGLPVVINSGIGDTDYIVQKYKVGVVVENFDLREYKKAIDILNILLKEGQDLRLRCREVAAKFFSLESGIDKYFRIYERLKNESLIHSALLI